LFRSIHYFFDSADPGQEILHPMAALDLLCRPVDLSVFVGEAVHRF
jgi:hypothetical protein